MIGFVGHLQPYHKRAGLWTPTLLDARKESLSSAIGLRQVESTFRLSGGVVNPTEGTNGGKRCHLLLRWSDLTNDVI